jgi:glycine/D-amino acid oxidase-like deaminating enzyme
MRHTADVVVIGGGIIGCACAYYLARDGHRVVLVERGEIASGAASASGGWVIIQDKETSDQVSLALASRRLYDDLSADAGVQVLTTGGLILAARERDRRTLHQQAEVARAGGAVVEELDGSSLRELEPALSPDLLGALHCAQEGVVDPPEVCRALVRGAERRGAAIQIDTPVTGIEVNRGRVARVVTSRGPIATRTVICAAGAWSSQIGAMVGLEIPVTPRRGHLIITEGDGLVHRPMLETGYLAIPDDGGPDDPDGLRFVMQPRPDGRCAIGSSREFAGFDRGVNVDLVRRMHAHAARFVPRVARSLMVRVTVGFRPYLPGGRSLVEWAGAERFLIATGHEGEGVTLAPVTGKMVADMVVGRVVTTV